VLTETPVRAEVDDDEEHQLLREHIVAYRIDGALFFGAAQRFLTDLSRVADVRVVILRLPDLQVLDATGAHALAEIVADLERRHITVLLKGLRPEHERLLRAVGAIDRLASEHHVFATLDDAIAHARLHVARDDHDSSPRGEAAA
jgi:SulP family sulfate permease